MNLIYIFCFLNELSSDFIVPKFTSDALHLLTDRKTLKIKGKKKKGKTRIDTRFPLSLFLFPDD